MLSTLVRLFRYDEWANLEALKSIRAANTAPAKAVQLLAHIASAQSLWLQRIQGVPQSYAVWPEWPLSELESQLTRASQVWRNFLGDCAAADLVREFEYTNTKGRHFRSGIGDTALHVAMHGTYHRGQIAMLLRQNGSEPAYTDFIEAVRTGKLAS